jgi:MATE family multidrug resistance protein
MSSKVSIKEVNRLAFPAMLAGIAEPLIGLADNYILGNVDVNSSEALAAVGIAAGFYLFLFWIFVQIESSLSAMVAQHLGRGEKESLNPLISQGLACAVFIVLALIGVTNLIINPILDLYGAEGLVKEMSRDYYRIRSFGFPLILLTSSLWGVFRGLQNTSWAMMIGLSGATLNIVLTYSLVHGVGEVVPAMGVKGAAIGSLSAEGFMLISTLFMARRKTNVRLAKLWPLHRQFGEMMVMSFQFVIRTISLGLVLILASASATQMGHKYMAAHSIAHQLWIFCAFVLDGYANAGTAIAGKLIGQRAYGPLAHLTRRLLLIGFGVAAVLMAGFGLSYNLIGGWFSNDAEVVVLFESIFWLVILGQPLNSVAFTMDGVYKGLGEAKYLMKLMVIGLALYALVVYPLLANGVGFISIWIAISAWMVVRSIWPWIYFKIKFVRASEE